MGEAALAYVDGLSASEIVNSDLVVALIVAVTASALAVLWPGISARFRRERFRRLLTRELREIGPRNPEQQADDLDDDLSIPWWNYLSRGFIHEQFLRPEAVAQHRDFVLQLDPDLVYRVSQLWMAYDSRNLGQWCYFLGQLSSDPNLASDGLEKALANWKLLEASRKDALIDGSGFSRGRQADATPAEVIQARLGAYAKLLPFTEWLPGDDKPGREERLKNWFYEEANGLLLSGDAFTDFLHARKLLLDPGLTDSDIRAAMSALRTELKIDLGVRDVTERHIPLSTNQK